MFIGKLFHGLTKLPGIIQVVEGLVGAAGSTKHEQAANMVKEAIGVGEAIAQKDIVDEQLFSDGLNDTIGGIVKLLNASVWHKSKAASAATSS